LDWHLAYVKAHREIMTVVSDLNWLYQSEPALFELDFDQQGFEWIEADDADNSILVFCRHSVDHHQTLLVLLNFTPVPRDHYCVGVDRPGCYLELFNSDSERYGGSNYGNMGALQSYAEPCKNKAHTLAVNVPPLGGLLLKYVSNTQVKITTKYCLQAANAPR